MQCLGRGCRPGIVFSDTLKILDGSLREGVKEFFMEVFDHICSKGPLFWANMSEHCDVEMNIVLVRQKSERQAVPESLDIYRSYWRSVLAIALAVTVARAGASFYSLFQFHQSLSSVQLHV